MNLDPFELRLGNYVAHAGTVLEITAAQMAILPELLPALQPIPLLPRYVARLGFVSIHNADGQRMYQKYAGGVHFNLYLRRSSQMVLWINDMLKLPAVQAIHQLQNVYYELSGDVLRRLPAGQAQGFAEDTPFVRPISWERRSGPGKYRTKK